MAETYRTDEEQVEALKQWWADNGRSIMTGLIVALAVVVGVRWWMASQNAERETASLQYEQMLQQLSSEQTEQAQQTGSHILENYEDTPYAVLAAMALAKTALEQGDRQTAVLHLRWANDHAESDAVKDLARLRLARALLAEGNTDEALKLASEKAGSAYEGAFAAVRGDVFAALGNTAKASAAYNEAVNNPETPQGLRQVLRMKLENLPLAAEGGEAS